MSKPPLRAWLSVGLRSFLANNSAQVYDRQVGREHPILLLCIIKPDQHGLLSPPSATSQHLGLKPLKNEIGFPCVARLGPCAAPRRQLQRGPAAWDLRRLAQLHRRRRGNWALACPGVKVKKKHDPCDVVRAVRVLRVRGGWLEGISECELRTASCTNQIPLPIPGKKNGDCRAPPEIRDCTDMLCFAELRHWLTAPGKSPEAVHISVKPGATKGPRPFFFLSIRQGKILSPSSLTPGSPLWPC